MNFLLLSVLVLSSVYGSVLLRGLVFRTKDARFLSANPIPQEIRQQFPNVQFLCNPCDLVKV